MRDVIYVKLDIVYLINLLLNETISRKSYFFETVKSKVIISLFETVRLSVSISPRNLYNPLKSIKENIVDYLRPQGVTACKRFKIKKDGKSAETNILLLTFDRVSVPKPLKNSIVSFRLMYIYRILCAVLTARGSDIMKTTVLRTPDLCVRTRADGHITPVNVKNIPNV